MSFEELLMVFKEQPLFDISSVLLLFSHEMPATVRSALYRFARDGKIISLKRGLYAFSEIWRKAPLHAPFISSQLYTPSYISERWALAFYGVIPEKVPLLTAVSTRVTRTFSNAFGEFRYRSLAGPLFFGYTEEEVSHLPVFLACPEKALLDLWYLESGEWSAERMHSFRFNPEIIKNDTLSQLAELFKSPRIDRALKAWEDYAQEEKSGGVSI